MPYKTLQDDAEGKPDPQPQRPAKRATNDEYRSRVQMIRAALVHGTLVSQCERMAMEQWGVNPQQAKKYVQEARQSMLEDLPLNRLDIKSLIYAQLQQLLTTTRNERLKFNICQEMAKLWGCYEPIKIAPTTPDGLKPYRAQLSVLTVEQLQALNDIRRTLEDNSEDVIGLIE